MDADFENLKMQTETDLGRSLDRSEEIELKALYYFSKGVKAKNTLESEPERLGNICKRVLGDIQGRMEKHRTKLRLVGRQARVVSAIEDFTRSKLKRRPRRCSSYRADRGTEVKR